MVRERVHGKRWSKDVNDSLHFLSELKVATKRCVCEYISVLNSHKAKTNRCSIMPFHILYHFKRFYIVFRLVYLSFLFVADL